MLLESADGYFTGLELHNIQTSETIFANPYQDDEALFSGQSPLLLPFGAFSEDSNLHEHTRLIGFRTTKVCDTASKIHSI
jgi:hypothetical protein